MEIEDNFPEKKIQSDIEEENEHFFNNNPIEESDEEQGFS